MDIYIVMKVAIYNHDIFGAFNNKVEAIRKATELSKSENDNHHSFDVVKLPLNAIVETGYNEDYGQFCEQRTVFSITKSMKTPAKVPDLWAI